MSMPLDPWAESEARESKRVELLAALNVAICGPTTPWHVASTIAHALHELTCMGHVSKPNYCTRMGQDMKDAAETMVEAVMSYA